LDIIAHNVAASSLEKALRGTEQEYSIHIPKSFRPVDITSKNPNDILK
jgi:hypothetical protein